jgi:hypothetical protein
MIGSKRVKWIIQTVSDSLRIKDTYVEVTKPYFKFFINSNNLKVRIRQCWKNS